MSDPPTNPKQATSVTRDRQSADFRWISTKIGRFVTVTLHAATIDTWFVCIVRNTTRTADTGRTHELLLHTDIGIG